MRTLNQTTLCADYFEKIINLDTFDGKIANILPFLDMLAVRPSFLPKSLNFNYSINNSKITLTLRHKRYNMDLNKFLGSEADLVFISDIEKFRTRLLKHYIYAACMSIIACIYMCSKRFLIIDFKPNNVLIDMNGKTPTFNIVLIDNEFSIYSYSQIGSSSFSISYDDDDIHEPSTGRWEYTLFNLISRFIHMGEKSLKKHNLIKTKKLKNLYNEIKPAEGQSIKLYLEFLFKYSESFIKSNKYCTNQYDELKALTNTIVFSSELCKLKPFVVQKHMYIISEVYKTLMRTITENSDDFKLIVNSLMALYKNFSMDGTKSQFIYPRKITIQMILSLRIKLEKFYHAIQPSLYNNFIMM